MRKLKTSPIVKEQRLKIGKMIKSLEIIAKQEKKLIDSGLFNHRIQFIKNA